MHLNPIKVEENIELKPFTTFKIGGRANFFVHCKTVSDLKQSLLFAKENDLPILILGGSSNMVISDSGFSGLVIAIEILGKEILKSDLEKVWVKFFAGENWDESVKFTVEAGLWGLENLSHIPGKVGASAVQNIGAYGSQISDCLESLEVLEIKSEQIKTLTLKDCEFGYRKSIFNSTHKGEFVILSITFCLEKSPKPNLNYIDLQKYFINKPQPSLLEIRQAIIEIRNLKFPFPKKEVGGNAGSFFKNLTLTSKSYGDLKKKFQENFTQENLKTLEQKKRLVESGEVKIPTAYILEICGWVSREMGKVKVNPSQPLVLLNLGGATAKEVLAIAKAIRQDVFRKTGLSLEIEPDLVGFSEREIASFFDLGK